MGRGVRGAGSIHPVGARDPGGTVHTCTYRRGSEGGRTNRKMTSSKCIAAGHNYNAVGRNELRHDRTRPTYGATGHHDGATGPTHDVTIPTYIAAGCIDLPQVSRLHYTTHPTGRWDGEGRGYAGTPWYSALVVGCGRGGLGEVQATTRRGGGPRYVPAVKSREAPVVLILLKAVVHAERLLLPATGRAAVTTILRVDVAVELVNVLGPSQRLPVRIAKGTKASSHFLVSPEGSDDDVLPPHILAVSRYQPPILLHGIDFITCCRDRAASSGGVARTTEQRRGDHPRLPHRCPGSIGRGGRGCHRCPGSIGQDIRLVPPRLHFLLQPDVNCCCPDVVRHR